LGSKAVRLWALFDRSSSRRGWFTVPHMACWISQCPFL